MSSIHNRKKSRKSFHAEASRNSGAGYGSGGRRRSKSADPPQVKTPEEVKIAEFLHYLKPFEFQRDKVEKDKESNNEKLLVIMLLITK